MHLEIALSVTLQNLNCIPSEYIVSGLVHGGYHSPTRAAREFYDYVESRANANLYQFVQGVSAVKAFYELLSQSSLNIFHPDENKHVAPVELCPLLKTLYKILIMRYIKFFPCFPRYVCSSFIS